MSSVSTYQLDCLYLQTSQRIPDRWNRYQHYDMLCHIKLTLMTRNINIASNRSMFSGDLTELKSGSTCQTGLVLGLFGWLSSEWSRRLIHGDTKIIGDEPSTRFIAANIYQGAVNEFEVCDLNPSAEYLDTCQHLKSGKPNVAADHHGSIVNLQGNAMKDFTCPMIFDVRGSVDQRQLCSPELGLLPAPFAVSPWIMSCVRVCCMTGVLPGTSSMPQR